jgi:hypothetical protein
MFSIGSEMVHPSKKLVNDHAYDAQSFCSANQTPELFEHGVQAGPSADLQSFACKLIELFAKRSARQVAVSPAPDVLQSADEMEMAELNDPTLGCTEPDNSRNLVGDRGSDASVDGGGNGCKCLSPALHVLSARQEHRIEKEGSILTARLDGHHIQDPVFASEAKVKSVQEQNQRSSWQAQHSRSGYKTSQGLPPTVSDGLLSKASARRQTLQGASLYQNGLQQTGRISPTLATSVLCTDTPRLLATTALTTTRTEAIDFCSATSRFRVQTIHARELHTN